MNKNENSEKEFLKVPEWMCNDFPVLENIRVAKNGALKWFDGDKDLGYVWTMPVLRDKFGVREDETACFDRSTDKGMRERKKHAWWLGIGNGRLVLRPNFPGRGKTPVQLHRIVAAAWVPNDDTNKMYVCFRDRDKMNVNSDNLVWVSGKDMHSGNY